MAEERKVSDLSDEEKNALIGEVAGDIDGRKRAAKGKLAADYLLKNVLARTLDYYVGRDPGLTVKQQRLANEAARREGYEEDLKQDTFQNRTAYSERLQTYMDNLAGQAGGSLNAENQAKLEQAKQTVSLANSAIKGISKPKTEQAASENARKAAYKYLKIQSQGRGGPEPLESLMANDLDSIFEIDEFARYVQEGMNIPPGGNSWTANFTEDVQKDPEGAITTQYPLTPDHISELEDMGFDAKMPEQVRGTRSWGKYRAARVEAQDLPVKFNGLNKQDLQKYQQWHNLQEEALERIDALSGSAGMRGQLVNIAKQGLTSQQLAQLPKNPTVADVFVVQTGMSLNDAMAADAILEDEVSQALDYMLMSNNFDPLLSNQNYISAMDRKGMNAAQFAHYLKNRRGADLLSREKARASGANDPGVAEQLSADRTASAEAQKGMFETKAAPPSAQAEAAAPKTPGSDATVDAADDESKSGTATPVRQRTADAAGQRGGVITPAQEVAKISQDIINKRNARRELNLGIKRDKKARSEAKRSTKDKTEDTLETMGTGPGFEEG